LSANHDVVIRDVDGERRIAAESLPLRVGTGSDCAIRLPGPGGAPNVLLDMLDGSPFVQPVGRDGSMQVNGEPLHASRRLTDGDEIQFFGSRIRVSNTDDGLTLEVRLEDSAYVTKPPDLPDTSAQPGEETIAPTAFQRAAKVSVQPAEQSHNRLQSLLGGAVAFLLLISYLLFSAKSIEFEVNPAEPDNVSISGGWFRLPIGDRVLLRKGEYKVEVQKKGYYEVSQTFIVDDEPSKTIEVSMRRLPGSLTVITHPVVEAVVSVDSDQVGSAPYGPIELQPGAHSIKVRSDRYLPFDDVIQVPGLGRQEAVHVQLVRRWSNVEVTSEPSGASIFSGADRVGETPASIELLEGTHQLSVVHDGYKAWDGTIVARPNTDQTLPLVRLQPANAKLLVNTIPRNANVTVNGRYRGRSPITLALSPDIDYEIGMSKAGYGATTRQVRLQAAGSESISVDLSARIGTLTVNVRPADAAVYVDGQLRATGTTTLKLSSAPHRIEVRKNAYQTWTRTVTPRPGYPQSVTASLRTLAAIEQDKIDVVVNTAGGQEMRRLEPGTFMMGASRSETGYQANQVRVPVTITKPYLIGVREVSNRQFRQFRESHDSGSDIHPSLAGNDNPVANVTWADAAEYCNWLSKKEGLGLVYKEEFGEWVAIRPFPNGYRLPTEAEWSWAIRYGGQKSASIFAWGRDMPPRKDSANYAGKSAADLVPTIVPRYDDGFSSTAPVGKFSPSPIGIYDGAGNVAEWANDYYTIPTPGITKPVVDPLGPERGKNYVIRGSSWRHAGVIELRSAFRDYGLKPRPDVGFRIARSID
jgi:formylglycine-generating enzyme required for sulfatase activity